VARINWFAVRASLVTLVCVAASAAAQAPPQGPQVVSPEVTADRRIVLRILAPQAQAVRLNASDIPGVPFGPGAALTKRQNGVWEMTVGPVPAGAYRYSFLIDGIATIDPRNPSTSESNNNSWSLVYVPGSDAFDTRNIPHGSVAEVHYYSTALKAFRRMHVYTPPGYETSSKKYPVFHFVNDFVSDVMPFVQNNYRVNTDRENTAIVGLSMGGGQTLNVLMSHAEPGEWETGNAAVLSSARMKKRLKLFWFSTGEDDFLLDNTVATVELFKRHGFTPVYKESAGGHTWLNWRDYLHAFALHAFAPQLFR
jgi:enterochelin esterase family protein